MVHTKHERTIDVMGEGDDMVVDEVLVPRQEKRQKKKQATRKPLCTFVNYLGPTSTSSKETPTPNDDEDDDDDDDDKMEIASSGGMSNEMKKLSLDATTSLDDSSTTSVETVNTSNKSVDAMVRDNRFNFDSATPAQDRWKEPPPPQQKSESMELDFGGLYVTSRCESDTESEDSSPDWPTEIVIRKRGRCPRMHRWQTRSQRKHNALPKFGRSKNGGWVDG